MAEPLRFVDEDTGEVIEATAGGLSVDALRTYALAKVRGDAARADMARQLAAETGKSVRTAYRMLADGRQVTGGAA